MAKRNTGSRRLDTRITQLDPAAVAVDVGNFTVANTEIVKPSGGNQVLSQAMDIMKGAGQLGRSIGSMRNARSKADNAAAAGDAQMAAVEDTGTIVNMFERDTLDKQEYKSEAGMLARYETLEDELLDRMAEGQAAGVAPEKILGQWTREQIVETTKGLSEESQSVYQAEYGKTYFPKVLAAASEWWNGRLDQRQELMRDGIASELATGAGAFPSPAAIVKESRDAESSLERLTTSQGDAIFMSAGNMARERGEWARANELYDSIPMSRRTESWYEGTGKLREGELQNYEIGLTEALIDNDGNGLNQAISRFQRPKIRIQTSVGWATQLGDYPTQDPKEVERFAASLDTYTRHPGTTTGDKAKTLSGLMLNVTGLAKSEVIKAFDSLPEPEDELAQVRSVRQEQKYQAGLRLVKFLSEGSISYGDGQEVKGGVPTVDNDVRGWLTTEYGEDGYEYYEDYLKMKDSNAWSRDDPSQSQDAVAAGFKRQIREAEATDGLTVQQARRQIVDRAFEAAEAGHISYTQINSLVAASESEKKFDAERWPDDVRDQSGTILQTFAAAAGLDLDLGIVGEVMASTIVQSRGADPAAKAAARKLELEYRTEWRSWHRTNLGTLETNPEQYEKDRTDWINVTSEAFTLRAIELGSQYSKKAYDERSQVTIGFNPFTQITGPPSPDQTGDSQ